MRTEPRERWRGINVWMIVDAIRCHAATHADCQIGPKELEKIYGVIYVFLILLLIIINVIIIMTIIVEGFIFSPRIVFRGIKNNLDKRLPLY